MAKPAVKAVLLSPQRALGGKPLLIVGPSLGTSSVLWSRVGSLLGSDFDVVAWDLPGHGVSPAAAETFSVADLADAVVDRTLQAPAAEQADTYRRLLREAVPADRLSDADLDRLLDPANYLGQAAEISRRILAAFPDYVLPSTKPASTKQDGNGDSRG